MAKKPGPQCLIAIGAIALLALLVGFVVVPAIKGTANKDANLSTGDAAQGAKPGNGAKSAAQIAAEKTSAKSVTIEFSRKAFATGADQLAEWRQQFTLLKYLTPIVLTVSDKITTSKAKEFLIEPYTIRAKGAIQGAGGENEITSFDAPTATITGELKGITVTSNVSSEKAMYHSLTIDAIGTDLAELKKAGFIEATLVIKYSNLNKWNVILPSQLPKGTTFTKDGELIFNLPIIIAFNPCKTSEAELLPFDDALTAIVDCYATQAQMENAKYHEDYWANQKDISNRLSSLSQNTEEVIVTPEVNVPYLKELLGAFDIFNTKGTETIPAYSNLWGSDSPIKKENDYYTLTKGKKTVYLGRSLFANLELNKESNKELKDLIAAKDLKNNAFASLDSALGVNKKLLFLLEENLKVRSSQVTNAKDAVPTETQRLIGTQTSANKNTAYLTDTKTVIEKDNAVLASPFNEKTRAEYVDAIMKVVPAAYKSKKKEYLTALNEKYGTNADLIKKLEAEKARIEKQASFINDETKPSVKAWDRVLNIKQPSSSLKEKQWAGVTVTKDSEFSIELTDKKQLYLDKQAKSIALLIDFLNTKGLEGSSITDYYETAYGEKTAEKKAGMLDAFDNPIVRTELETRFGLTMDPDHRNFNERYSKELLYNELNKEATFLYAKDIVENQPKEKPTLAEAAASSLFDSLNKTLVPKKDESKFLQNRKITGLVKEQNKDLIQKLSDNKFFGELSYNTVPTFKDEKSSLVLDSIELQKYFNESKFYKLAFTKGIDIELNYQRSSKDSADLKKARDASELLTKQIAAHFTKAMSDLLESKVDKTTVIQKSGKDTQAKDFETQLVVDYLAKDKIYSSKEGVSWAVNVYPDQSEKLFGKTTAYIPLVSEEYGTLKNFFKIVLSKNYSKNGALALSLYVYNDSSKSDPYSRAGSEIYSDTSAKIDYCFASGGTDITKAFFCIVGQWDQAKNTFTITSIKTNNAMKMTGFSFEGTLGTTANTPQNETFDQHITGFGTDYYNAFKGTTLSGGIQEEAKPDKTKLLDFAGITYSDLIPDLTNKENLSTLKGYVGQSGGSAAGEPIRAPVINEIYTETNDLLKTYKGIVFLYSEFFPYNVEATSMMTLNPNFARGSLTENVSWANSGNREVPKFILENIDKLELKLASPKLLTFQANKPEKLTIDSAKCFVDVLQAKNDNSCDVLKEIKKTPTQVMQDKTAEVKKTIADAELKIDNKECNQSGKCTVILTSNREFGVGAEKIEKLVIQKSSGDTTLVGTKTETLSGNAKSLTVSYGAESEYAVVSIKTGVGSVDSFALPKKPIIVYIEDSKKYTIGQSATDDGSTLGLHIFDVLKPLTFVANGGKDATQLNQAIRNDTTGTETAKPTADKSAATGPTVSIASPTGNVTVKVGDTVDLQGKIEGTEAGKEYGYLWALKPDNGDSLVFDGRETLSPGSVKMVKEGTFAVSLGLYSNPEKTAQNQIAISKENITITVTAATAATGVTATVISPKDGQTVDFGLPLAFEGTVKGLPADKEYEFDWRIKKETLGVMVPTKYSLAAFDQIIPESGTFNAYFIVYEKGTTTSLLRSNNVTFTVNPKDGIAETSIKIKTPADKKNFLTGEKITLLGEVTGNIAGDTDSFDWLVYHEADRSDLVDTRLNGMGPLEITVPAGKEGTFTVLLSLARKRQNQTITDTHRITITIKKE